MMMLRMYDPAVRHALAVGGGDCLIPAGLPASPSRAVYGDGTVQGCRQGVASPVALSAPLHCKGSHGWVVLVGVNARGVPNV